MNFLSRYNRRNLKEMLRLSDQLKAAKARARDLAQNNLELVAVLTADAQRRGQAGIDWPEYFRNAGWA